MPQTVARTRFGPETYEVASTAINALSVVGGALVQPEAGNTGKIILAALDSTIWLGVALYDAQPAGTVGTATTWGFATVDASVPQPNVAVAWQGVFKLKAVAALNFGDVVYPGASGQVQKTSALGRAVGQVIDPLGIAAGAYGLIRLF